MPRLALCMIVRDEERMLPGCLESVRNIVDEIVVVDTGSTDGTVAIAQAAGARVVPFTWCDDFAAARNAALPHVTADWILVLDADERLAGDAGERIHRAIGRGGFHLAQLPLYDANRQDASLEEVLSGAARDAEPVYISRLFRRLPDLRWHGIVHEGVTRWGSEDPRTMARLRAAIVHFGYSPGYRASRGKAERNVRLLRRSRDEAPDDARIRMYLASELRGMRRHAEASAEVDVAWSLVQDAWASGVRPQVVSILTVRSLLLEAEGRTVDALAMLDAAEAHDVKHPNVDYLRGLLLRRRAPAEAEAAFERALAMAGEPFAEPVHPGATGERAREGLAAIARDRGDWTRVKAVLAPHAESPSVTTSLLLAEARLVEDPERARSMLESLPASGDRDLVRAAFAEAVGDAAAMTEALAACREAMPFTDEGRMARWIYLDLIRRGGTAWEALTAPTDRVADAAHAVAAAGRALSAGDARAAVGWTRTLLRRHPGDVQAWAMLSLATQLAGQPALAVAVSEAAARAVPDSIDLRAARVLFAEMSGDRVAAARHARALQAASPGHADADAVLGRLGVHRPAMSHGDVSVSVVVAGSAHREAWTGLLDALALQDEVVDVMEVVLVDPPDAARLSGEARPYRLRVVTSAGPQAAWDDGWRGSAAACVVFLAPDAVPAPGALHALRAASAGAHVVHASSRLHPTVADDTATLLLVEGDALARPGADGRGILSPSALVVPREVLSRVGGLARDLTHPWAVGGELAARLSAAGIPVVWRADVVVDHAPAWTVDGYLAWQEQFGAELYAVWRGHGDAVSALVQRALGGPPVPARLRSAREHGDATAGDLAERSFELRHALGRVLPGRAETRSVLVRTLQASVSWHRWRGAVRAAERAGVSTAGG